MANRTSKLLKVVVSWFCDDREDFVSIEIECGDDELVVLNHTLGKLYGLACARVHVHPSI